jgi:hypothetical protein
VERISDLISRSNWLSFLCVGRQTIEPSARGTGAPRHWDRRMKSVVPFAQWSPWDATMPQ